MAAIPPPVAWAQRQDRVYLTVNVPEAVDLQFTLENDPAKLTFSCVGGDKKKYHFALEFFAPVDKEVSAL